MLRSSPNRWVLRKRLARSWRPTSRSVFLLSLYRPVFSPARQPCPSLRVWRRTLENALGSRKHSTATAVPWHSAPFYPLPLPQLPANGENPSEPRPSCGWGGSADSAPHFTITSCPGILTQLSFPPNANLHIRCRPLGMGRRARPRY